jgi:glucose-6-phosphate-specific signal transduction histidine kinase
VYGTGTGTSGQNPVGCRPGRPVNARCPVPLSTRLEDGAEFFRVLKGCLATAVGACAGPIAIDIAVSPATVVLTVTDAGPPRPQSASGVTTGHGLIGIRERARLAGGAATAGPRRSGGWAVSATLPLWDRG